MGLTYQIYINGRSNDLATKRMMSFEIIDNIGLQLDSLSISINNADKTIEIPTNNVEIELAIGDDNKGYDNLYKMGKFIAQYIDANSSTISINAISQDLSKGRVRKNRVFKAKSLQDILQTLANELNLKLQIDKTLALKQIDYYIQDNKTSTELIYELSEIFYAVANIKDGNLIFISKDNIKTLKINENNILSIKQGNTNNKLYSGVMYETWNTKEARLEAKKLGNEPYLLIKTAIDKSIVNNLLNAKYKEIKESVVINLLVQGNADYQSGFMFEINSTEKYDQFNGKYRIEKVTHKYSNAYVSEILAVKI